MNKVNFKAIVAGHDIDITLYEGQTTYWGSYETTEEGHHNRHVSWHYGSGSVFRRTLTDAKDCDGPLRTNDLDVCPADRLHIKDGRPEWTSVDSTQYDGYAVQAGY